MPLASGQVMRPVEKPEGKNRERLPYLKRFCLVRSAFRIFCPYKAKWRSSSNHRGCRVSACVQGDSCQCREGELSKI